MALESSTSDKAKLLIKNFLGALIFMFQEPLYLLFLLELIETAEYLCNSQIGEESQNQP